MKYKYIESMMYTYFDWGSGLDIKESERLFLRALDCQPYRSNLHQELKASLSDDEFSWYEYLKACSIAFNEGIKTELEARTWMRTNLLGEYF